MESCVITESLFGVVGDHGNSLMIYDTDSIVLRHQIHVGQVIRSFQFTHNNAKEVVVVTKDQRVRFYSLSRFEGLFLKELTSCHREGVSGIDLSQNGGFMITGGDDNLLKLWDTDAQKTVPYWF
jgi:WD40 repeat protein